MCFSIQGEPSFIFSLISDTCISLNGQFVLPEEKKSHVIAKVSTYLGNLGLMIKNSDTGNITSIKISAQDHSVAVQNTITIVKDEPVIVQVFSTIDITIGAHTVKFYKKYLDMFLTRIDGLTTGTKGIIGKLASQLSSVYLANSHINTGQFFTADVTIDEDEKLMKLNDGHPIPVKKAPIWPYTGLSGECWYGTTTDNQGSGIMKGVYTDYIVEDLFSPAN